MTNLITLKHTHVSKFNIEQNNMAQIKKLLKWRNIINLENMKYIHVYKFNTEHNNVAKIITEECNELCKSEIYTCLQV
jgi:hypothetical protein